MESAASDSAREQAMRREYSAGISMTGFRDECLIEHWLFSLAQALQMIENRRREDPTDEFLGRPEAVQEPMDELRREL